MSSDYDAIIVGGGLGGLTAAATLAQSGRSVRLFERHTQPGGYASTFFSGRFEFDVGLHELSGIGTPSHRGSLYRLLDDLGVAEQLTFVQVPTLYRSIAAGLDVRIPPGRQAALEALVAAFPHERRGLTRLMDRLFTITEELDAMVEAGGAPSPTTVIARYPNVAHAAAAPLAAVLDRELTDPRAKLAFAQLWGYFGLPPSQLSLLLFAVAVVIYLRWGGCVIGQKSQALSNALADAIRRAGGRVSLGHGVARISVEAGRVTGVVTDRGETYTARTIVANANPLTTCTELIDGAAVPEAFRRRLAITEPGLGSVCVYLGLRRPSRALGIEDHEVFFNDTADLEAQYESCLQVGPPKTFVMCAYDVEVPSYCPPDTGAVVLVCLSDGRAWRKLDPGDYPRAKQRIAQHMVRRAEQLYPELGANIETAVVATPITNMRYTGNPNGAIYGFANTPSENPGFRIEQRGPLEGLWFAGAWTQPGGSFHSCMSSGRDAAQAILAEQSTTSKPASPGKTKPGEKRPLKARLDGYRLLLRDAVPVTRTLITRYGRPAFEQPPITSPAATRDAVERFHPSRCEMRITQRVVETPSTVTLHLQPLRGRVPPHRGGQYVNVTLEIDGVTTSRAYSLSSWSPQRNHYEITVKERRGGQVSPYLVGQARVGQRLQVSSPAGEFVHDPLRDSDELVLIAAGSGVTPLMAMIDELQATESNVDILLLYGSRSEEELIFGDRLADLERISKRLRVVHTLTKPSAAWAGQRGRLSGALIDRHVRPDQLERKTFFVCGPRPLKLDMLRSLEQRDVPRHRVQLESYGTPEDVTAEPGWPNEVAADTQFTVSLRGRRESIQVSAGQPLLNSLERAGEVRHALCRSDVCDTCKARLLTGEVFVPADDSRRLPVRPGETIRLCMAYPLSDIELDD